MGFINCGRSAWGYAALALVGCAGRLENEERFVACEPGLVERLFATKCVSCHAAEMPQGALDLVSPRVTSRLVDVPADLEGPCSGHTLISTGGDHLLLDKLEGTACGGRMPLGGAALSSGDLECVRQWIEGAIAEAP